MQKSSRFDYVREHQKMQAHSPGPSTANVQSFMKGAKVIQPMIKLPEIKNLDNLTTLKNDLD